MCDQLGLDAEPLRQHRIEHGGVALAGRLHVEAQDEPLAARKVQRGRLEREAARVLEHAGNPDPAVLAALARLATALLEAVIVGECQRLVDHRLELARVDRGSDRGLVGQRRRPDQIALAQLYRVDAGDARGLVDHALQDVVGLGAARAAIGRRGRGVGEDAARIDVDQLDVVHAGQAAREVQGLDVGADGADIGAHAAEVADAQREKLALLVERQLDVAIGVARVVVAEEGLGTVRHPMHGPADLARGDQDREVFGVRSGLQSECTAHILGDDTQLRVGNAEDRREPVAQGAGALRAAAQEIAVVRRIVGGGGAARLHGMDHDALVHHRHTGDVLG